MSARVGTLALAFGAALVAPAVAHAQAVGAGAGITYEGYFFSDETSVGVRSLSLLTVPLGVRANVLDRAMLDVTGAWARGALERPDGTSVSVDGPTDTEIRLAVPFGRDRVTIEALVALPTGKETLTADEAVVAGAIAADVLPFRITNWGSGGGYGGSAAVAGTIGSIGLGASVGYVVAREYEPLEVGGFAYRPGDQLRVQAAMDAPVGAAGKASLKLSMQRFGEDEMDGANLYRSGNRYQAIASYAFAAGARSSGIVYAGALLREEGELRSELLSVPSQDLFLAGGGLRLSAGSAVLMPRVDARVARNDAGLSQGYTIGIGGSAEVPAGAFLLLPSLAGRFGNAKVRENEESGFAGIEAGLTIRLPGGAR